jgi:hypothetical protein
MYASAHVISSQYARVTLKNLENNAPACIPRIDKKQKELKKKAVA